MPSLDFWEFALNNFYIVILLGFELLKKKRKKESIFKTSKMHW